MKHQPILLFLFGLASAGYAATKSVELTLLDSSNTGPKVGTVVATDTPYGLLLTPNLKGLTPGIHGFHLHENPSCEAAKKGNQKVPGLGAGGHFDPDKTQKHDGPYGNGHLGDLPPLFVMPDGTTTLPVLAPRLTVKRLQGHSLMVHAGGDNFSDTPSKLGGGGARMACGVIR